MKGKIIKTVLPFLIIFALVIVYFCLPKGKEGKADEKTVVEVWNIDTFEGGKGSRTAFLNRAARRIEGDGVYYYILSYTTEGAREAFSRGVYPDMLSFGAGLGEVAEKCLPLGLSSAGGEVGGKCLAAAWAAGKYFLFSLKDDFTEAGKTAISVGGANLPAVAANLSGIDGEELPSTEAYVRFLNGEFRYLLGTQRDECRFLSRGVTVYRRELKEYDDLYQYISVLSPQKMESCMRLVETLLSEETQNRLSDIGMYPPRETGGGYTLNVFSSAEAREELLSAAREGQGGKILEKYLKSR